MFKNPIPSQSTVQALGPVVTLIAGLILIGWFYSLGWSASLLFDDESNLQGLKEVFNDGIPEKEQLIFFVLSGNAGPTGRPISLLSFLIDGGNWGFNTTPFFYTNTLFHLLNASIICLIVIQLGRALQWSEHKTGWVAVLTTLLWAGTPLLTSASFLMIQRMTLVSSLFMLLGLLGYLTARARITKRPQVALIGMGISLGLGTLLGVFSKEQAALLPVMVLVLEVTVLPRIKLPDPHLRHLWQSFLGIALILPSVLLMGYLLYLAAQGNQPYALRHFNLEERLWTEAGILWRYLLLAFFPRPSAFGPFHDGYPVSSFGIGSALAAGTWLILVGLAIWQRRRLQLFALAVLWFIAAHLLESTVVPLELYFEHRNYLALSVPFFAFVAAIWSLAEQRKRLGFFAWIFAIYLGLQFSVLGQITSLYGNPDLAAELWFIEHPHSERAAQYLAQRYTLKEDYETGLKVLDEFNRNNESGLIQIQALQLACFINTENEDQLKQRVEQTLSKIPKISAGFAVLPTLNKLLDIRDDGKCLSILTDETLTALANQLLANLSFAAHSQNKAEVNLFLATIYTDRKNYDQARIHLEQALKSRSTIDILSNAVFIANCPGHFSAGLELLQKYPPSYSRNAWVRKVERQIYEKMLEDQQKLVEQQSKVAQGGNNI